jgi:ribosomal protein L32E
MLWTEANRRLLYQTWQALPRTLTKQQMVDAIWQRTASVTGADRRQTQKACARMRLGVHGRYQSRKISGELEDAIRKLRDAGYKQVEIAAILDRHDVRDSNGKPIEQGFIRRLLHYYLEVPT